MLFGKQGDLTSPQVLAQVAIEMHDLSPIVVTCLAQSPAQASNSSLQYISHGVPCVGTWETRSGPIGIPSTRLAGFLW